MIFGQQSEALRMEIISLKARLNALETAMENLMVSMVDHPEWEKQAKMAEGILRSKGWRIAQNRKAVEDAQELQNQLKVMAEDYPVVAEMLLK